MTDLDLIGWAALAEAVEGIRDALAALGRIFVDAVLAMEAERAAAREADRAHGRTWLDMLGPPRAARAITEPAPMVWRWTWTPMYGRR